MKTAIIVAPGTTLNTEDIPVFHEVADTVVALNRAVFAWAAFPALRPHAVYAVDGPACFRKELEAFLEATDLIVTENNFADRWENVGVESVEGLAIDRASSVESNPFESQEGIYSAPVKTTLLAWQHLIRQGYKRIGFTGVDGRVSDRPYFYDAPVEDKCMKARQRNYNIVIETIKAWQPWALEKGVESVNLSGRESRLASIFPTVPARAFMTSDLRERERV